MTRKRTAGLILTVAAVAAVLWLGLRDGNHGQMTDTFLIASIQSWPLGNREVFRTEPYAWLSDHEILHFIGDVPHGYSAVTYNTATRREQPEPSLTCLQSGYFVSVSPDQQWVLWNTQTAWNALPGMAATRRADGKTIRWHLPQLWRGEAFWLPDSRHWVGMSYLPTGKIAQGRPVTVKRLVMYDMSRPNFRSYAIPGDTGIACILGVTSQGHVIINNSPFGWGTAAGQPEPPISLVDVTLDGPHPVGRVFQVTVPKTPNRSFRRVDLSPQGDRLLWTCLSPTPISVMDRGRRWAGLSHHDGWQSQDIWTCPLNGTAPRHIGTWSGAQMGFASFWNPDGKHISLSMEDKLYLISVP